MLSLQEDDDITQWRRLKNGDRKAFEQVYQTHVRQLSHYCRRFTADQELIEDTLHDMFVQLWTRRESLGDTHSIIGYLTVTVRRDIVRRIQTASQTTGFDSVEYKEPGFLLSPEESIVYGELQAETAKKLKLAMESLSDRQREALYLRYFENMEYEDICEAMNINYQSVRNLISKAIIEMRKGFIVWIVLYFCYFFYKT